MDTSPFEILKSHHSNENKTKADKCNQCSFASAWPGSLKEHLKIHSGEKIYKCNQCDHASAKAGNLKTIGEENEYSENELLELLQIKPGKRRRSSGVKRLPKSNPDSTHSPDPPPKYYKIDEVIYHEKKSNALEAIERDKKDKREKTDNQLSPILSKGELLITGGTGNYQILQPERNEVKNPRGCEASMLEAAKMRAKLKWTCNTCGKYLSNEKKAKDHMRMGELKLSGKKNKMMFSGRGKCVVVSKKMYSEEEIHLRTGFGLVDGTRTHSGEKP